MKPQEMTAETVSDELVLDVVAAYKKTEVFELDAITEVAKEIGTFRAACQLAEVSDDDILSFTEPEQLEHWVALEPVPVEHVPTAKKLLVLSIFLCGLRALDASKAGDEASAFKRLLWGQQRLAYLDLLNWDASAPGTALVQRRAAKRQAARDTLDALIKSSDDWRQPASAEAARLRDMLPREARFAADYIARRINAWRKERRGEIAASASLVPDREGNAGK